MDNKCKKDDRECSKSEPSNDSDDTIPVSSVVIGCIGGTCLFVCSIITVYSGSIHTWRVHLDGWPARMYGVFNIGLYVAWLIFVYRAYRRNQIK